MGVSIQYLIVAGGGGSSAGGGGGGGGLLAGTDSLSSGNHAVTVGTGGGADSDGNDSVFNAHTADGGGSGGAINDNGGDGGSGGGGAGTGTGGAGSQGYAGGNGDEGNGGAGGGGKGQAGANASGATGGKGGDGEASSISGSSITRAGGGGGGAATTGGAAGTGGGGTGGSGGAGTNGENEKGGGGGGSYAAGGRDGGSGVVILRFLTSAVSSSSGGTKTTDGAYTIHTFTSSGTFTFLTDIILTATRACAPLLVAAATILAGATTVTAGVSSFTLSAPTAGITRVMSVGASSSALSAPTVIANLTASVSASFFALSAPTAIATPAAITVAADVCTITLSLPTISTTGAISGSQKALMYAQSGVARSGATRSGYHSPYVFISIGGTHYATGRATDAQRVLDGSLVITDLIDEAPTTCSFATRGFVPTEGQAVIVTMGSKNTGRREFAGRILRPVMGYLGNYTSTYFHTCNCIDHSFWLNKRKVWEQYTSSTVGTIAADLIGTYASGYTVSVNADISSEVIDEITFTAEDLTDCLTRICRRVGAHWKCDYNQVVYVAATDTSETNPVDLTDTHASLSDFEYARDVGSVVTRVIFEGGGGTATTETAVGATEIPVDTDDWYNSTGGTVVSGSQRITYTGISSGCTMQSEWMTQTPAAELNWRSIAWSPELSLFAAVEFNAAGAGLSVMTSPDGIAWTSRTAATETWIDICWSPDLGMFAAVAYDNASTNSVLTSTDGVTWTVQTAAAAKNWTGIAWSPSLALFVAVEDTTGTTMYSSNGVDWSAGVASANKDWSSIAWSPELALFVAVGGDGAGTDTVMTSSNGTGWTTQTGIAGTWNKVTWASDLALFIAVGNSKIMTSPNGTAWTSRTVPESGTYMDVKAADGSGRVIAVTSDGTVKRIAVSDDGITWTLQGASALGPWTGLAWSPELGRMVAVAYPTSGTLRVMTNTASAIYWRLAGIPASGDGSILRAIKQGDPVNLLATINDVPAQTALAALIGGDGIQEEYLQDRRLSYTESVARGTAQRDLLSSVALSIRYRSRDRNSKAGRTVTVNLGAPFSIAADFTIQRVTVSGFLPNRYPVYEVEASSQRFSLEDLLRMIHRGAA